MKYLVLGGAGFMGRHLVERLVQNGEEVRVFDKSLISPEFETISANSIEYISGNFSSIENIEKLVKGVDIIFHLISTTLPKSSNDDPVNDVATNVIPTLHLLDAARKQGIKKIIYFSSGGTVYGVPKITPTPEDHSTLPLCSYGIHKVAIENYLHLYFTQYGLSYSVMRVSNPYGGYQRTNTGQGVIPVFLQKFMSNESIDIWGDGSVVRDYIHVSDVIDAAIKLVEYKGSHKVFNIGNGQGHSLNDLIIEMASLSGHKAQVNYLPARSLDVPVSVLDISRANQELNWNPKISLSEGIGKLLKSYSN
jgi:UDP-glucose 4-epimerase